MKKILLALIVSTLMLSVACTKKEEVPAGTDTVTTEQPVEAVEAAPAVEAVPAEVPAEMPAEAPAEVPADAPAAQ